MRRDVIFDVDGTLLNIQHRVHLVRPLPGTAKDWKAFRAAAVHDTPHANIVAVAKALFECGHRIIIASGRMQSERAVTRNALTEAGVHWHDMYLRAENDFRADYIVKGEMLQAMLNDGYNPALAFDDRNQVVKMWREAGIQCCQVAPGEF